MQAKYDKIAERYDAMNNGDKKYLSILDLSQLSLLAQVGEVAGKTLVDIGCGTGTLALHWAQQGATVIGVDYSSKMLEEAKNKANAELVRWVQDDAQVLSQLDDDCCDIVASNFALMDIPDLQAVYSNVRRILKPMGRFVFTITHPCFQSPHAETLINEDQFDGRRIVSYASEGHWRSTNSSGIRGQVGAHHRTVSTYVNGLIGKGFLIQHMAEPTLEEAKPGSPHSEMMLHVPGIMLFDTQLAQ